MKMTTGQSILKITKALLRMTLLFLVDVTEARQKHEKNYIKTVGMAEQLYKQGSITGVEFRKAISGD